MKERKKKRDGQNKTDGAKDGTKEKPLQEEEDKEDCPICCDALPRLSNQFVRSDVGNFGVYSWMVTFVSSAFAVPELVAEDFDASFISGAYVTSETVVEGSNYGVVLQQESVSFIGSLPLRSSIQEITLASTTNFFFVFVFVFLQNSDRRERCHQIHIDDIDDIPINRCQSIRFN